MNEPDPKANPQDASSPDAGAAKPDPPGAPAPGSAANVPPKNPPPSNSVNSPKTPAPSGDGSKPHAAATSAGTGAKPQSRPMRRPMVAAPDTSKRDAMIAIVCGALVLAAVIYGIVTLKDEQMRPSRNQVTGVIVAKHASGEREKEISVGRKGLRSEETDSGFYFEIRVDSENRTFEVPVNEGLYLSKKVGDQQTFIRPPSEQK